MDWVDSLWSMRIVDVGGFMLPPGLIEKQHQDDEQQKQGRWQQQPRLRIADGRFSWEQEQQRRKQQDNSHGDGVVDFRL